MEYRLISLVSADTNWQSHYAFEYVDTCKIVTGKDNNPTKPYTFLYFAEAVHFVADHCEKGSTIKYGLDGLRAY